MGSILFMGSSRVDFGGQARTSRNSYQQHIICLKTPPLDMQLSRQLLIQPNFPSSLSELDGQKSVRLLSI